ncbi:MAG: universal stress protein [Planctomycetota bacterium]|jgi:nucleotide-binding universal stress UspA family protein
MSKVDQFESTFRSAVKEIYSYQRLELPKILVVTDLESKAAVTFGNICQEFLWLFEDSEWTALTEDDFSNVAELLQQVSQHEPDLICTYRHLHSDAWKWPHSLGEHVDVLTQVTSCPVMVLPHPERGGKAEHAPKNTDRVMAITDHMTGDHRLVNFALRFTEPNGKLFLTHVEDQQVFDRYIELISKIAEIDTDLARETIHAHLLKEPTEYIESCREVLKESQDAPEVSVEPLVVMGHRLSEYERLIEEHQVDLLVMNTKDDEQFAMHGLAYPLAVDLRSIPLLML